MSRLSIGTWSRRGRNQRSNEGNVSAAEWRLRGERRGQRTGSVGASQSRSRGDTNLFEKEGKREGELDVVVVVVVGRGGLPCSPAHRWRCFCLTPKAPRHPGTRTLPPILPLFSLSRLSLLLLLFISFFFFFFLFASSRRLLLFLLPSCFSFLPPLLHLSHLSLPFKPGSLRPLFLPLSLSPDWQTLVVPLHILFVLLCCPPLTYHFLFSFSHLSPFFSFLRLLLWWRWCSYCSCTAFLYFVLKQHRSSHNHLSKCRGNLPKVCSVGLPLPHSPFLFLC